MEMTEEIMTNLALSAELLALGHRQSQWAEAFRKLILIWRENQLAS